MLLEKSDNGSLQSLPPIVKHSQLYPLVTTYENIFDYQEIFFALLLLEIWEEVRIHEKVKAKWLRDVGIFFH